VSKQRISKIVQGNDNLTIETIYNLEQALGTKLIAFPEYKYSIGSHMTYIANAASAVNITIGIIAFDIAYLGLFDSGHRFFVTAVKSETIFPNNPEYIMNGN
jgi:transcriptional regulator with XRE-family HTH domain